MRSYRVDGVTVYTELGWADTLINVREQIDELDMRDMYEAQQAQR